MRIVIFEDNDNKFNEIQFYLISQRIKATGIFRVKTVAEFAVLEGENFDFCILDLRMPSSGTDTINAGLDIIKMLDYSGRRKIPRLAITAFSDEAEQFRDMFAARGCLIYDFDKKDTWQQALDITILQVRDRGRYDFIIFTALEVERAAFLNCQNVDFDQVVRYGVDHWEFELDGKSGSIVLLPRMGLVTASIVAARVLEHFAPKAVAMSGICAGLPGKCELGQLLVTDVCFEYQSGKWLDEVFQAEPYQVKVDEQSRTILTSALQQPNLLQQLELHYKGNFRPAQIVPPRLAVFATGSAVIASEVRMQAVAEQHRKVAGIDMEIFGFHRAVELSDQTVRCVSAKTVVDQGNNNKNDDYHAYGAHISAQFILRTIPLLLAQKPH